MFRWLIALSGLLVLQVRLVAGGTDIEKKSIAESVQRLPLLTNALAAPAETDWLVKPVSRKAGIYRTNKPFEIVLTNRLISRTFLLSPDAATVAFDNLMTHASMLRAVEPEAMVTIDGTQFNVGGLAGQTERAYLLPVWIDSLQRDPNALHITRIETGLTKERFPWTPKRWSMNLPWPPPGVSLTLYFEMPHDDAPHITVAIHYEMYDGLPLLAK